MAVGGCDEDGSRVALRAAFSVGRVVRVVCLSVQVRNCVRVYVRACAMSDVVESLFVMESDRTTPRTPPLMETRPCIPAKSTPYVRHRKTSSGLWNLDMEKLMAFPVEALPPDEEVDLSHHLSDKLRVQDCMKVDAEQEINTPYPLERQTTSDSDCSDGVDTTDGGSISWPPTPSCKHALWRLSCFLLVTVMVMVGG